jgi:RHS repeat-associated protein
MRKNGTLYYLTEDHLGSTALATDTSGAMVARNRYYPQGGVRTQWGTMPTDKLFTGQQRESADVYDYGARMYNTSLGRMPQADPLVPDAFNPQSYNAYSYVVNNPANYTDPTGMFFWGDVGGGDLQLNRGAALTILEYARRGIVPTYGTPARPSAGCGANCVIGVPYVNGRLDVGGAIRAAMMGSTQALCALMGLPLTCFRYVSRYQRGSYAACSLPFSASCSTMTDAGGGCGNLGVICGLANRFVESNAYGWPWLANWFADEVNKASPCWWEQASYISTQFTFSAWARRVGKSVPWWLDYPSQGSSAASLAAKCDW